MPAVCFLIPPVLLNWISQPSHSVPMQFSRNDNSNTNGVAGKTDEIGYVPNIYYVHPLSERLSFGLGINAPYGLASDYEDDWYGRYLATHSKLEVANFNAVVAYALSDKLSLG